MNEPKTLSIAERIKLFEQNKNKKDEQPLQSTVKPTTTTTTAPLKTFNPVQTKPEAPKTTFENKVPTAKNEHELAGASIKDRMKMFDKPKPQAEPIFSYKPTTKATPPIHVTKEAIVSVHVGSSNDGIKKVAPGEEVEELVIQEKIETIPAKIEEPVVKEEEPVVIQENKIEEVADKEEEVQPVVEEERIVEEKEVPQETHIEEARIEEPVVEEIRKEEEPQVHQQEEIVQQTETVEEVAKEEEPKHVEQVVESEPVAEESHAQPIHEEIKVPVVVEEQQHHVPEETKATIAVEEHHHDHEIQKSQEQEEPIQKVNEEHSVSPKKNLEFAAGLDALLSKGGKKDTPKEHVSEHSHSSPDNSPSKDSYTDALLNKPVSNATKRRSKLLFEDDEF